MRWSLYLLQQVIMQHQSIEFNDEDDSPKLSVIFKRRLIRDGLVLSLVRSLQLVRNIHCFLTTFETNNDCKSACFFLVGM